MRSYRALLNFTFSFGRNVIGTILGLITTPYILHFIGEERFGALRILLDWLSHIGILEFGLYSASLALLGKSANEGKASLYQSLQLIFKNYFLVFVLQMFSFLLFIFFIEKLIPVSPELQKELRLSAVILAITLLFLSSQVFKAFLESAQKGYIVSIILVVYNVIYLGTACLLANLNYGLPGQALAYVLSLFVCFLLFIYFAPEVLKSFFIKSAKSENQILLKKQRFSHFINELCGRISLMSDNIIISIFMGAEAVTAFFITQKAVNMLQQQLQHISNSSWAALSELYYQDKKDIFKERVLLLTEIIAYFSGATLSVACLYNPSFVSLWTGEHTYAGNLITQITAINAALFSILSLWSWCFAATNKTDKMVWMSIAQGTVNIIASIVLTQRLGIIGPLLGTLIGYAGISLGWKSFVLARTFHISLFQLTSAWICPLILPFFFTLIILHLSLAPQINSWISLIFFSALSTFLYLTIAYLLLLRKTTKLFLREKTMELLSYKLKGRK